MELLIWLEQLYLWRLQREHADPKQEKLAGWRKRVKAVRLTFSCCESPSVWAGRSTATYITLRVAMQ